MNKTLLYILMSLPLFIPSIVLAETGVFTTFPSYSTDHSTWIVRDVNPGGKYEEYITLENLTENKITLEISMIESSGDKSNIQLLEKKDPKKAGLWITPGTNIVELNGQEHRQIKLNINIPGDAKPGEYQAVAMVTEKKPDNQRFRINTRIGNRIYLNVTLSNDLKTNTFIPDNYALQTGLIILSLGGILYGTWPLKKHTKKR